PFNRSDLVDRFHRTGRVEDVRYTEDGVVAEGHIPSADLGRYAPFVALRSPVRPHVVVTAAGDAAPATGTAA
ncbi:MAG: hypothetical protein H0U10_12975, partial [Chloroflexia bacterium]|nr:hypothetical protein [Chloroflexia bacterium]